ncbi:Uncharacterised protein [Mycobacteroides abscessus subsp. abscessus]|nr:Uncharacterised protein [Mycobacteroides abscessus subsp. abscessus]
MHAVGNIEYLLLQLTLLLLVQQYLLLLDHRDRILLAVENIQWNSHADCQSRIVAFIRGFATFHAYI